MDYRNPAGATVCRVCGAAIGDRITEADLQFEDDGGLTPADRALIALAPRLIAEVRRLRALVVAQADLGCCSMHERCEGGCGAELVEAEAKAIRAESAPKGPGTEAGTRAKPGS